MISFGFAMRLAFVEFQQDLEDSHDRDMHHISDDSPYYQQYQTLYVVKQAYGQFFDDWSLTFNAKGLKARAKRTFTYTLETCTDPYWLWRMQWLDSSTQK